MKKAIRATGAVLAIILCFVSVFSMNTSNVYAKTQTFENYFLNNCNCCIELNYFDWDVNKYTGRVTISGNSIVANYAVSKNIQYIEWYVDDDILEVTKSSKKKFKEWLSDCYYYCDYMECLLFIKGDKIVGYGFTDDF